ncbi:MAG: hypothetical protein ACI9ZX_001527 [Algoriphagus sp.]|jgi:hypothetical protein
MLKIILDSFFTKNRNIVSSFQVMLEVKFQFLIVERLIFRIRLENN